MDILQSSLNLVTRACFMHLLLLLEFTEVFL